MDSLMEPTCGADCPSKHELEAFQLGRLDATTLQRVVDHLDGCPACSDAVHQMRDRTDPLLQSLRQPRAPEPFTEDESRRLVEQLQTRSLQLFDTMGADHQQKTSGPNGGIHTPAPLPGGGLGELGQYELLQELGAGGMGKVYKARHKFMNKTMAVKVIHRRNAEHQTAIRRFLREIQALASLDHRNIVRAHDANQVDDTLFLAMEFVEGETLSKRIKDRGRLPVAEACATVYQAALGLQHAHEKGLVHRDIKPSNLIATPSGVVKILDLGLALIQEEQPAAEDLTATGQMMGTVDYMAPEQWENTHGVDIRADIYSLGCTLFHLLTGQPPFAGTGFNTMHKKMKAHVEAPVPDVRALRPEVPPELARVLECMLAKHPEERFATPGAVAAALRPFFAATDLPETMRTTETGDSAPPRFPQKFRGRRTTVGSRGWLLAALVLLAVVGALSLGLLATAGFFAVTGVTLRPGEPDHLAAQQPGARPAQDNPSGPGAATRGATGTAAVTPGSRTRGQQPPPPPPPDKPPVVELRVTRFAGDEKLVTNLGDFGKPNCVQARFNDDCKVFVTLDQPAYLYLVSFDASGNSTLCYPDKAEEAPRPVSELEYPGTNQYFGLTDGVGYQAFVVLASRQPLPSYRQAFPKNRRPAPWTVFHGEGVWIYDGKDEDVRMQPVTRGPVRQRDLRDYVIGTFAQPLDGGVTAVPWAPLFWSVPVGPRDRMQMLVNFFQGDGRFETVRLVGFPVVKAN